MYGIIKYVRKALREMLKRIVVLLLGIMLTFPVILPAYAEEEADVVWYHDLQFDKSTGTIIGNQINRSIDLLEIPSEIEGVAVTKIGRRAFRQIRYVRNVIIPNTVTDIGDEAFFWSDIETVSLPDSVVHIGEYVFENNENLRTVRLPSNLTSIPRGMFCGCENLMKIDIPDSVTEIGDDAFAFCPLRISHFPDNLVHIGAYAFLSCDEIEYDTFFPASLKTIGEFAFDGCWISNLVIPAGVTDIGEGAFACHTRFIEVEEGNAMYAAEDDVLFNKDKTVLLASASWLERTTYEIPSKVTRIGSGAFAQNYLTEITIPDHVTEMGSSVFRSCKQLESAVFQTSLTEINDSMFLGCWNLRRVELPVNLTQIGEAAFSGCTGLREFTIPETVSVIGDRAFSEISLKEITIPAGVTAIGERAFEYSALQRVRFNAVNCEFMGIPNQWGEVEYPVFRRCFALTEIIVGENVKKIPDFSFWECSALERVVIPASVNEIGNYAFEKNSNFTIYGDAVSYAQQYAEENDIPFVVLDANKIFPSVSAQYEKLTFTIHADFNGAVTDRPVLAAVYDEDDRMLLSGYLTLNEDKTGAEGILKYDPEYYSSYHKYVKVFIFENMNSLIPVGYVHPMMLQ